MKFKKIGLFIARHRTAAGMTQRSLARSIGYTPQFVANWERGASGPPDRVLLRLVKKLNISKDAMIRVVLAENKRHLMRVLRV